MKKFRFLVALVLAMTLVASVMSVALADPTNTTITIPDTDNHTYAVYQIYTGELADGKLSNVHYGKNAKNGAEGVLVPQTELDTVAAITGTDAYKAGQLEAYANLTGAAFGTVSSSASLTVPTGYYLIKDNAAVGANDEATLYILQVVGPVTITRKAGTTTSDKTTDDANDSEDTAALNASGQTSSDYDIGDEVPYQVKATLSEKVYMYETSYKVEFVDTLESGRFDAISALNIKVNGTAIADTDDYTVAISGNVKDEDAGIAGPTKDGFDVTIVFTPKEGKTLTSLNSAVITIDFTATLGEGAQIGGDGNTNTVKVKYSNNPNSNEEGETTEHKVTTFTFKVIVNKVDGNEDPLANAGFTLYKVSKDDAVAGVPTANAGDAASKNAYWATKAIAGSTKTIAAASNKTSFSFEGLDDGYYVLAETATPAGFNTIDPQVFVIAAEHSATAITSLSGTKLDGSTITFTPDTAEGSLTATIKNQSGATLPSTGGIGTTIFYVVGIVLVLGAAAVIIARRKAEQE